MKIYPVNTAQKSTFKGRMFTVKKFKSDTKDFFEAAGVVLGLEDVVFFCTGAGAVVFFDFGAVAFGAAD